MPLVRGFGDTPPSVWDSLGGSLGADTGPSAGQLTLMDGRIVNLSDIAFNNSTAPPNGYHFTLTPTGEDITNQITRADKIAHWPNFDPSLDNDRLYREQHIAQTGIDPGPPLETNVLTLFGQNVNAQLERVANPAALVGDVKDLLFIGAIGLAVYLVLKGD